LLLHAMVAIDANSGSCVAWWGTDLDAPRAGQDRA